MCVSKKIQIDVFISHIPAPHRLCASCPLPPMTQCPSAPKKHTHTHTVPWLSPDQSSAAVYLQPWENGTTALILSCVSITLHTRRLGVLPGLKTEWEFGGKWISNIKERVCFRVCAERGWGGLLSWESGPQKPPCVRVQPWNQPDPIDSVYLARLQVKAIGNLGEIWRGLWIHREREGEGGKWAKKKKKSNTVCSTVWQSRRVFRSAFNKVNGDFSPRASFYCKRLTLARCLFVIIHSSLFLFLFISSPSEWRTCWCFSLFCFLYLINITAHQMQLFQIHPSTLIVWGRGIKYKTQGGRIGPAQTFSS